MFTKREKPETEQLEQAEHGNNTGGYMAELDQWLIESIFTPIEQAVGAGDTKELYLAFDECNKLIKRKVLASYHNGLKAKITSNPKTYGQQTYRRN